MFVELVKKLFELDFRETWAVQVIVDTFKELFSSASAFFTKFTASMMVIIEMFSVVLFGYAATPRGQALNLDGYSLVFEDEFEGDSLDTSVWYYRANGARRNGFNAPSQVSVRDGNLIMRAQYLENGEYGSGWYAGMIALTKKYKYGYFEIRCICNPGKGFWSAYWLQSGGSYIPEISKGGVGGAEIDIFEAMSYGEDRGRHNSVTQTIHCSGKTGDTSGGLNSQGLGDFKGNNIYEEYNTYGLEWTEDEYIFYINGVETNRTSFADGVSQAEEEVIVSLEIPSEPGDINFEKDYTTDYIVDYVKIWQKD